MKTKFNPRFFLLLTSTIFVISSFAQQADNTKVDNEPSVSVTSDDGTNEMNKISPKTLAAFNKHFKNVSNQKWSLVDNKFAAKFTQDGRVTRVLYSKKGYMIYSISYGTEKNLPADLRKIVRTNYLDFSITATIEVNQYNKTIWIVNLEDATSFLSVRLEDYEMEELKKYQKSK